MSVYFERPVGIIQRQSKFSSREVGINHPDMQGFIKIADNGDIQIMASEDLGIIISPSKQSIFFVGKTAKFATNEIKWNQNKFNPYATTYEQSTLLESSPTNLYEDVYKILE